MGQEKFFLRSWLVSREDVLPNTCSRTCDWFFSDKMCFSLRLGLLSALTSSRTRLGLTATTPKSFDTARKKFRRCYRNWNQWKGLVVATDSQIISHVHLIAQESKLGSGKQEIDLQFICYEGKSKSCVILLQEKSKSKVVEICRVTKLGHTKFWRLKQ